MSDPDGRSPSPAEAFALVDHETRVAILLALQETPHDPVSFSDLRERVGERDSGKFNYHLRKLTGPFVRQSDGGYELTRSARQLLGAVFAGTYTDELAFDPVPVPESECAECGGRLAVSYRDGHARFDCTDCGSNASQFPFPPGSVEQFDRERLPYALSNWYRALVGQVVAGFCPNCSAAIDGELLPAGETPYIQQGTGYRAVHRCERCGDLAILDPEGMLTHHPAVVGFYYDHGVDLTGTPFWTLDLDSEVAVVDDAPTLAVTYTLDDDQLTLSLGPDLTVGSVERDAD